MADRPLLILSKPGEPSEREPGTPFRLKLNPPSKRNQFNKFKPIFLSLLKNFSRLRLSASGAMPEEVLVLETKGAVDKFVNAVKRIEEFEWLGELETDEIEPDEDFYYYKMIKGSRGKIKQDAKIRKHVYMVFSRQAGLLKLLSLWNVWRRDKKQAHNLGKFSLLFDLLSNIRR
jgi:hypothetical protein